ncbi:MAG: hypothetical protein JO112_13295, partial [Planctomycetes bacterium]|nr:hypothetical protein [Planctomycetota bacterium]
TQLALIDQRFGLGADARAVQVVLLGIQQTRQADAQRAMEAIMQRIYQPPIVIPRPPIYQPPITIPQAPGMPSISIPQAPLYQPPIIIPR